MIRWSIILVLTIAPACGGGGSPEDEVTESWTAGDDEPLGGDEPAEPHEADEPAR